jgi:microcystin synthetase protein McyA
LFEHQTVAQLATVVRQPDAAVAEQGDLTGETLMTPVQHWLLEQGIAEVRHFNQSVMLEVPNAVDPGALADSVAAITRHHDALRLRFEHNGTEWQARYAPATTPVPLERYDLGHVAAPQMASAIEELAASIQGGLDIAAGPCVRVALFDLGGGRAKRLLFAVHHLVVDGVSWRVLLEDFWTAYSQRVAGRNVALPPKTASFRQWASSVHDHADSPETRDELEMWLEQVDDMSVEIPTDATGPNTVASVDTVTMALDVATTRSVLTEAPTATRTHIDDVLLAALGRTLTAWCGRDTVCVDLERHGREELSDDIDLSRTVGWLTNIAPARLTIHQDETPAASVRSIAAQVGRRRFRGIGFGALRYVSSDERVRERLAALPPRALSFNYLGQFGRGGQAQTGGIGAAPESPGPMRHRDGERTHLVEVNGSVVRDCLTFEWTFSRNLHSFSTIHALAEAMCDELRSLVATLSTTGPSVPSATDYPAARLTQHDLDTVLRQLRHAPP